MVRVLVAGLFAGIGKPILFVVRSLREEGTMKRIRLFRRKTQSLPTNIENATTDYVRDHLAEWDQKILARRAARLGTSVEEASKIEPKPLYLIEAEQRAEAEGRTVASVLQEYSERLEQSTYPGPECFLPDEVLEYVEAGLSPERLEHANSCAACASLLAASQPLETAKEALIAAVTTAADRDEDLAHAAFSEMMGTIYGAHRAPGRNFVAIAKLKALAEEALPAAGFLLLAYLALSLNDVSAARLTFLHNPIPWVVATLMAALSVSLILWGRHVPIIARRIGAGVAAGVVIASLLWVDFRQSQSNRDLALAYAQDRLVSVCADSIGNYEKTGTFLETKPITGTFQLLTAELSDTRAKYVMTGKELPGRLVCNVGSNGGDLKWEYGKNVGEKLDLLTGTLRNTPDGAVVELADGKELKVESRDYLPRVTSQAQVLAAVDPATQTVRFVGPISDFSADKPGPASRDSEWQFYHAGKGIQTYLLPAGTMVSVRTEDRISSATAVEGQTYAAEISDDVLDANGDVVIPRGSNAQIVIRSASKGRRFRGTSDLVLDLQSISVEGQEYLVSTTDAGKSGKRGLGANKRTAEMTGGGAALGAVIGAIAGGGKGAAIGAGAGAGGGALTQVLTKGDSIRVPPETVLTFRLDKPVQIVEAK